MEVLAGKKQKEKKMTKALALLYLEVMIFGNGLWLYYLYTGIAFRDIKRLQKSFAVGSATTLILVGIKIVLT